MRIGIDARFYGVSGKGLGRYASELIRHLEIVDQKNEYLIFLRRENFDDYQPQNPNFKKKLAEFPWYGWREQLLFPLMLLRCRLDLMHFCHFNVPLLYRRPFVVTVHDLILLSHPTPRATTLGPLWYKIKYLAYRLVIGHALRRARITLTVSHNSETEIKQLFPFMRERDIRVTYPACSPALSESGATAAAAMTSEKIWPRPPYFIYVGNAYPHKNLDRLLAGFSAFRQSGYADYRLVLVGAPDYFYNRLRDEATRRNQSDNVIFFGQATDMQLQHLYTKALAYVFPSLCEGFGLPPLEAMCRDLPVAAARSSCLPEVLGEAADWFNPELPEEISASLHRLAEDDKWRAELIERGHARRQLYDWKNCAEETFSAYRDATK